MAKKCAGTLIENPKEVSLGPWMLSFDEKSISRCFLAKNWTAAMEFLNQVSELAEKANHHPDLHLTNWRNVRIVLTTHSVGGLTAQDVELAQAIDQIRVDFSPQWLREQEIIDPSEDPVQFNESHYQSGLNGEFTETDAVTKFGVIFENKEMRDIAAAKEELVKAFRISPGDVVADIGAGMGLLVPLLSEAVGGTGKVIISELSPLFCQHMTEHCKDLPNIAIVDSPTDRDPKISNEVDLAIMVDVYHHLEYPQAVLRNVRKSLKRHGALIVVDFHRDPARIKSHDKDWVYSHLRGDQATFSREIERTGFVQVEEVAVPGLPENYFLVFRKRPLPLSEPGAGWTC